MEKKPRYSILIPAFKARFLEEAITSVLCQSFTDLELILVDDCSPEDLRSIVEPFLSDTRVRYYRNDSNFGAVDLIENWNRCLSYASGEYIICMGDDDRLLPHCLSEYEKLMDAFPGLGVYHAMTDIIDETGKVVKLQEARPEFESSLSYIWHRLKGRVQFIGDFCFNASLLKSNGGFFRLPLAWGSDDISAYIAAKGNGNDIKDGIANTQTPCFQYRDTSSTITSMGWNKLKFNAKMEYLDWFRNEFSSLECNDRYLPLLKSMSDEEIARSTQYLFWDMKSNPANLYYWLHNRKSLGLGAGVVVREFIKSLVKN